MSGMAPNSQLKRGSNRNGKERVQWQWQQHLWNIHLKRNQRTMKVQETKANHRTKATSREGEARHRVCDMKSYTDATCQNYFTATQDCQQHNQTPRTHSVETKANNKKATTQGRAGTILQVRRNRWSQQATQLKYCRWDYIYTAHRKIKLRSWLVPEEMDSSPWRAQSGLTTIHSKSKNKETGNKKERVCERTLLTMNSHWRRQDNSNN